MMSFAQVWRGKLHVPGMFRAHVVADMLAGTGDIGKMFTRGEVCKLQTPNAVTRPPCIHSFMHYTWPGQPARPVYMHTDVTNWPQ